VSRSDIPYVKTYFRLVKAEARSRIRALRGALRPEPGLRRASPRECCRVSAYLRMIGVARRGWRWPCPGR
jgi:hypothetical protein